MLPTVAPRAFPEKGKNRKDKPDRCTGCGAAHSTGLPSREVLGGEPARSRLHPRLCGSAESAPAVWHPPGASPEPRARALRPCRGGLTHGTRRPGRNSISPVCGAHLCGWNANILISFLEKIWPYYPFGSLPALGSAPSEGRAGGVTVRASIPCPATPPTAGSAERSRQGQARRGLQHHEELGLCILAAVTRESGHFHQLGLL